MHSKDARTKNPSKTTTYNTRPDKTGKTRKTRNLSRRLYRRECRCWGSTLTKKLREGWAIINLIHPTIFHNQPNDILNKNSDGEFWVETVTDQVKLQWLANTGSPRSFINTDKAIELTKKIPNAAIHPYKENTKYRCFNNNNIQIRGVLHLNIRSGSWSAKQCKVQIVGNKTNNIMGRDLLAKIGITLNASKPMGKQILQDYNIQTENNILKWILQKYPHLCTRLGRSKNHIAQPIFKANYTPSQHKGCRVPLHLLEKFKNELKKPIDDGQINKLEKCPDDLSISPVVFTVKKDKSVKIALDSKKLNDASHKNKYQMQSIDHLIDSVALYISERKNLPGQYWFSKVDLKYAYSQILLDENTQKRCNFNILGGRATGTHRFINGFYGLTDMPATFQITIDKTLQIIKKKNCISRRQSSDNERKSTRSRKQLQNNEKTKRRKLSNKPRKRRIRRKKKLHG